jgi:hypothetical protein
VHDQAQVWAKKTIRQSGTPAEKVRGMYVSSFGREPTADETSACLQFVDTQAALHKTSADDWKPWADLAHTLFNTKEFIYVD